MEVTDECREKALTGEEPHYAQQLEEESAASAARSLGILSSDKLNRLLQVMTDEAQHVLRRLVHYKL